MNASPSVGVYNVHVCLRVREPGSVEWSEYSLDTVIRRSTACVEERQVMLQ